MNRKHFLSVAGSALVLLANGKIAKASELPVFSGEANRRLFRFAVTSDGHYGEKGTDYENHFKNIVTAINADHAEQPFRFAVVNGDIVHDDKAHYPAAKSALDGLQCRYYVSQGNHDKVTQDEWQSIWGMPVNYDFTYKKCAFLIATTTDDKGTYLCPDLKWLNEKLEEHKNREIYFFIHINPGALTRHAVDCPELFEALSKHKKIRAVFNGHDHHEDGIKVRNNIPFVFDGHFGGSWGTSYNGYRVVEVMKDGSVITYIKTPDQKINNATV